MEIYGRCESCADPRCHRLWQENGLLICAKCVDGRPSYPVFAEPQPDSSRIVYGRTSSAQTGASLACTIGDANAA